jgi:hypothetical protein
LRARKFRQFDNCIKINKSQRVTIALLATGIALIVFAHNPVEGYTTGIQFPTSEFVRKARCTDEEAKELDRLKETLEANISAEPGSANEFLDNLFKKNRLTEKCVELKQGFNYIEKDFLSWSSDGALVSWLAVISHLLLSLALAVLLAAIWFYVLADKDKRAEGLMRHSGSQAGSKVVISNVQVGMKAYK